MSQTKVLDAVKVSFLLVVILVSFSFVGEMIIYQNTFDIKTSQQAGVLGSMEAPKTEERGEESDCNDNEISTKYNAFGNGSSDPYRIYNPEQLRGIAYDKNALHFKYKQCKDINLAGTYSLEKPYFVIGSDLANFTGGYNGNGYSISNFEYRKGGPFFKNPANGIFDINGNLLRNNMNNVGLFGYLQGATVENTILVYPRIIVDVSNENTGSLAGYSYGSTINNFTLLKSPLLPALQPSVIQGGKYVGGVVGTAQGSQLSNMQTVGYTKVWGKYAVGGLVGVAFGSSVIKSSFLFGDVLPGATANCQIFGGLVGWATASSINQSYSKARVNVGIESGNTAGGLVGNVSNGVTISKTYATGEVFGKDFVGGLVGSMSGGEIKDSYATGNVKAKFGVGGFVGRKGSGAMNANIYRSYSTGKVAGVDSVGGFVGSLWFNTGGTITDSYSSSRVTGLVAGGFVGATYGNNGHSIVSSYSSGNVGGAIAFLGIGGTTQVGGFIGLLGGSENNSSYLNNATISNIIEVPVAPGIPPSTISYGKFVGYQLTPSAQFDKSYYWEESQCPAGCNTVGVSVPDVTTFYNDGLSKPPYNWTFDNNTWKVVPGGLPILPNAGVN